MNGTDIQLDVDRLIGEIQRYLATVDAFRAAGCSLRWRRERGEIRATTHERSS